VKDYGKPEIINSDQGSQFTCEEWISYLESEGIKISMDGKGRAIDNIFIDTNCIIRELTGRIGGVIPAGSIKRRENGFINKKK
jgi:hypothetical protein